MNRRGWSGHPLVQLTLLRFREFIREPEALFWTLVFPVLLTTGLGVAFRNQAPDVMRVGAVTAELAAALERDPLLVVDRFDAAGARDALRTGRVVLVAAPGPDGRVVYRYDDTNPEGRTARMLADRAVQLAGGRVDPVTVSDDLVREVGSRYIDFLVPGLVGMGIMSNAVWGLGFSIVDARRRKLMKRIIATPMRRRDYLMSFQAWRVLLLVFEVGVPVLFGVIAFGVPVRGSLLDMTIICLLGSLAFSALGLLLASRARTIEAVSGLMNVIMVPMWILSGVFFSSERFPDAVQPFIKALPLTALVDALRANMLRGATLGELGGPLAALAACLVVCFAVAMKIFRWK
jgi:ABC-type polysaccharide/polyol phosphate export permease